MDINYDYLDPINTLVALKIMPNYVCTKCTLCRLRLCCVHPMSAPVHTTFIFTWYINMGINYAYLNPINRLVALKIMAN